MMAPFIRRPLHDAQADGQEGHEHGRDKQWEGLCAPQQRDADEQRQAVTLLGGVEGGDEAQDDERGEGGGTGDGLL